MSDVTKDEVELEAWKRRPADDEWVIDEPFTHPDAAHPELLGEVRRRLETEHAIVRSLGELRRAAGMNQTQLAERWGRGQSQVSKVERDPANVELATLVGYVHALGGRLTVTVEAGNHVFYEDLVVDS